MPDFAQSISNRYRITGELGAGAMGVVYRAIQLDLNRPVAIKVLSEDVALEPVYLKRLKREARALSVLNHPGIVSVFDFDTTTADRPFLVMELVPGRAFKDVLKERRPSLATTLNLMQQAARALQHAHEKGIVHRDIKPANMLLDEERMELKIVDFGIARPASNMTQEQLTIQGEVFGSPLYMSPEQCSGKELDARSDIYSLGCVMFECIAGRPPFRGDSAFETMTMHLNVPPPVLREEFDLGLFKELSDIIAIALSKKPESRYQEMSQLAGDLDNLDASVKATLQKQKEEDTKKREEQKLQVGPLPVPPQPGPPTPAPISSNSGFFKNLVPMAIMLVFAAALAGFAYYMGTQAHNDNETSTINATPSELDTSAPPASIGLQQHQEKPAGESESNQSQQSLNPDEAKETKIDIPPGKGSQEPQLEQVDFDIKGETDSGSRASNGAKSR